MSANTLDAIVSRLCDWSFFGPTLEVSWHAGEPLSVPVSYYEEMLPKFNPLRAIVPRINHTVQTNGTLLSDDYCRLFKEHGVSVGVSIDGPAWLHDRHRTFRSGAGSHAQTVAGIKKLIDHSIPFYAIMVASVESLPHAEEIYYHMRDLGITFLGVNVEESEGVHPSSTLDGIDGKLFSDFIEKMFRLSLDDGRVVIRDLYMTATYLSRSSLPLRSVSASPGEILTFDWKGNVATYSPELVPFPAMDNTAALSISNALQRPEWRAVEAQIAQGLLECELTCDYFSVCGGGNPSNKLTEHGSFASTETTACRLQVKETTEIVLKLFEDENLRKVLQDLVGNKHLMRL